MTPLKEIREALGLSQDELGEALGASTRVVHQAEVFGTAPKFLVKALAAGLAVSEIMARRIIQGTISARALRHMVLEIERHAKGEGDGSEHRQ